MKIKRWVKIKSIDIPSQGLSIDDLINFTNECQKIIKEKDITDVKVSVALYNEDHFRYPGREITVGGRRLETDKEYSARIKELEIHEREQKEKMLKEYNRLKERLGL